MLQRAVYHVFIGRVDISNALYHIAHFEFPKRQAASSCFTTLLGFRVDTMSSCSRIVKVDRLAPILLHPVGWLFVLLTRR